MPYGEDYEPMWEPDDFEVLNQNEALDYQHEGEEIGEPDNTDVNQEMRDLAFETWALTCTP